MTNKHARPRCRLGAACCDTSYTLHVGCAFSADCADTGECDLKFSNRQRNGKDALMRCRPETLVHGKTVTRGMASRQPSLDKRANVRRFELLQLIQLVLKVGIWISPQRGQHI